MPKAFKEAFQPVLDNRVFELAAVKAMDDPEYIEWSNKAVELMEKLIDTLKTDEHKQLVRDLEDALIMAESITAEYSYKQGFKDGLFFIQETPDKRSENAYEV